MSPEQLRTPRGVDREDRYLVARGHPLRAPHRQNAVRGGGDWRALHADHGGDAAAEVRSLRPDIPAALEAAIVRCMRRRDLERALPDRQGARGCAPRLRVGPDARAHGAARESAPGLASSGRCSSTRDHAPMVASPAQAVQAVTGCRCSAQGTRLLRGRTRGRTCSGPTGMPRCQREEARRHRRRERDRAHRRLRGDLRRRETCRPFPILRATSAAGAGSRDRAPPRPRRPASQLRPSPPLEVPTSRTTRAPRRRSNRRRPSRRHPREPRSRPLRRPCRAPAGSWS